MSAWTKEELEKIAAAEELQLASRRGDGSLRSSVTIWVVRHGDELYVRCVNGRDGAWFRGTQTRHEGHIRAGGMAKEVRFLDASAADHAAIDAAYRAKYRRYPASYVDAVANPTARAATLRLVPRDVD
jgi:hypothetical protein